MNYTRSLLRRRLRSVKTSKPSPGASANSVLMIAFASVLDRYANAPDWIRIVLFFAIWGIYEPVCTTFGSTVGNYLKGIRVRRASDVSKKINFIQALVRYVLKMLLGWISFLTMHLNTQKRAIHDFAAGSVMIKLNRN